MPHLQWGQLGLAGNSGLIDLAKEPGRQRNLILYLEGQRPQSFLLSLGLLGFGFQKSLPGQWDASVQGQLCIKKTYYRMMRTHEWATFLLLCHGYFLVFFNQL